jgi:hypothetical protein
MGRVHLVALFFAPLCLLLYVSQDASAQSRRVVVAPSPDNDASFSGARLRVQPPLPKPRSPEIFY